MSQNDVESRCSGPALKDVLNPAPCTQSSVFSLSVLDHRRPLPSQPLPLHVNPACSSSSLSFPASPRRHTPLPVAPGSGCQMRTLDSGIGTFPLPDSVTRASGRHVPKPESSPDGVTAGSSPPDPSQPDVKVPSLHAPNCLGHPPSDPSGTGDAQDVQRRPPQLAASGESSTCAADVSMLTFFWSQRRRQVKKNNAVASG